MAALNPKLIAGATDLSNPASYDIAAALATWGAGSNLTCNAGGPVTYSNPNAFAAIVFETVKLTPGYTSPFGDASTPVFIQLAIDNDANAFFDGNSGAGAYIAGVGGRTIKTIIWRPTGNWPLRMSAVNNDVALIVESGNVVVGSDSTMEDFTVCGGGQLDVREHATDAVGNGTLSGATYTRLKRKTGAGKTIIVGPGTTLEIDLTSTSGGVTTPASLVGTVIMMGGTCVLINGTVTFQGVAGTIDTSRLQQAATVTVTGGTKDLTIRKGQNATLTVTSAGTGPVVTTG